MYYYNQNNYGSVPYPRPSDKSATVKSGGCGVCSACMVMNNLAGKELYSVRQMAEFSIKNGARDNAGTNVKTLLSALCKANPDFSYKTSNSSLDLVNHLKKGGIAICNQGDVYNVFSTAGHFVVAYRMSENNIEVLDPQMYSGKYDAYRRPQRIVKRTEHGCIVSVKEMVRATADRSPAYFLVTYTKPKNTEKKVNKVAKYGNAAMLSAQTVYADSDLTLKVGTVSKGERVNQLGTGEGNPMIAYKTASGYKVGFTKKGTVKKD